MLIILIVINLFAKESKIPRIVTISPAINEIVFALEEGKNVVANTKFCDFPIESKSILKLGSYNNISLEKILQVKPTVVITQDYDSKLFSNLKALDIKVKFCKLQTLGDIKQTILDLGEFFKRQEIAKKLNQDINEALKSLENIIINQKVLIVFSSNKTLQNDIYVAGNFVYFEDIIKLSGNLNAYNSSSKAQPVLNLEKIIGLNPDIIILLTPDLYWNKKDQENLISLWESVPVKASKLGNIYTVDKFYSGIPSHRITMFIEDFKKILQDVRDKKLH